MVRQSKRVGLCQFVKRGVAQGYGDDIDGEECYFFHREDGGGHTTTFIQTVATFW